MIFRYLFTIILVIAISVVLAIAAGYAAHGASTIEGIDNVHNILIVCAVVGWITIALTILGFIALIVYPEVILLNEWLRMLYTSYVYMILFICLTVGILMTYSAVKIRKSDNYGSNKDVYTMATHGGVVAIVMSGGLIITFIGVKAYTYISGHHDNSGSSGSSGGYGGSYSNKVGGKYGKVLSEGFKFGSQALSMY